MLIKIIVIVLFVTVVASMGSALVYLIKDSGDSTRMLKALTLRIGLSLVAFFLLMAGYLLGLIQPHGL